MTDTETQEQRTEREEAIFSILDLQDHDLGDGYTLNIEGPKAEPPIRSLLLWFQGAWTGETPDDTLGDKRFHIDILHEGERFDGLDLILSGTELSANTHIEYGFLSPYVRDMDLFHHIGDTDTCNIQQAVTAQAQKLVTQKNSEYSYTPIAAM